MHEGAELELNFKPVRAVTLHGMLSVGDWYYTKDAGPASVFNSSQVVVATIPVAYLKGIKIGDAAQTTAALGADIDATSELRLGANATYYGNYYSNFNFANVTTPGRMPYKLPGWTMLNLNGSFKFKLAGLDASLIGNVFNVANIKYISDAFDASALGVASGVNVYYGLGRTFTTSLKVKF